MDSVPRSAERPGPGETSGPARTTFLLFAPTGTYVPHGFVPNLTPEAGLAFACGESAAMATALFGALCVATADRDRFAPFRRCLRAALARKILIVTCFDSLALQPTGSFFF